MIAGLFGNPFPFATSWTFILCSVVFQLPSSLDNQGYRSSVVTFTKGQPLGFFSFWPLFTLTHHMLVWIAAERARRSFATMPFLATVIADEKVAAAYHNKDFLCTITISKEKSLISKMDS